jgi:nucleoid DNA-binding protein
MLTRNLISGISRKTGMTKSKTEELLNAFTAIVTEDVMSGQTVQLYGLGQLEIRDKAPRIIVHPRTGERNLIPAKKQLCFKASINTKEAVK